MFKCNYCDYNTYVKCDITRHFPVHHKDMEPSYEKIKIDIECKYCSKKYATKANLNRHMQMCEIVYKEKKENEMLKEKIKELENKTVSNVTVNNNNNNNVINNYITINLTPYNYPNLEALHEYIDMSIRKTFLSVPTLIENIHFNDKYPENHNISITNRRAKDAKVFDGKKWKTVDKYILMNEILDTYERELINYAEEQGNQKYITNYESAKKRGNGEKDLLEEVHTMIYDNSNKVNTKTSSIRKLLNDAYA